jgi:hypothetical protein
VIYSESGNDDNWVCESVTRMREGEVDEAASKSIADKSIILVHTQVQIDRLELAHKQQLASHVDGAFGYSSVSLYTRLLQHWLPLLPWSNRSTNIH